MKASRYLMSTLAQNPKEAEIASHCLMLRAGLVQQIASGIYAWLPLGLRVLRKIETIIRQEQNRAGCVEVLAPTLQPVTLWQQSGRYGDYGKELLRIWDRHERELLYGPTAEEVFTDLFRTHVHSYRSLPQRLYNIQWKFRDEIRPRFGVMRGREFLMKDTYSFDLTKEGALESYRALFESYLRTFDRMGLQAIPVRASTGPIGGDLSHEFQILADTGESTLYYDAERLDKARKQGTMAAFQGIYAMADEQHSADTCPLPAEKLKVSRGIEVGHVFYFGTKYSEKFQAYITTRSGERILAEMGSYGIGVSRLVGAIIEAFHDEKGIKWPANVAPFPISVMSINNQGENLAEQVYQQLQARGLEVFYHDVEKQAGYKFADLDLIGFPYQVIVSDRLKGAVEIKVRNQPADDRIKQYSVEQAINFLASACAHVVPLVE